MSRDAHPVAWRRLPAGFVVLLLAGCASSMDVRTLATSRIDQAAYELTGSDIEALRREARQLCPQGGEILRQSARERRLEQPDSGLQRWAHATGNWIDPPERSAQLLVLCDAAPGRQELPAAPEGKPAAAATGSAQPPASLPAASSPADPAVAVR